MADSQQLEFIIKAVDEASDAIAKVKASTDAMKASTDAASTSFDKNSDASGKAAKSNDSLSVSIFKGVASWALLEKAVSVAVGFVEDSVKEFLDAQQKIDLTKSTVIAMGGTLTGTLPQITAFGDAMGAMGVDNEDAELSAAKLAKAAGGDVPKGLQLAKLAADLASSGYGDLTTNTNTLTSVLAGRGTAAIKQYRLAISDTASTGQILDAIQGKVTQTTEDYASTIPGQIATVKQAYKELEQGVGEGFVNALGDAAKRTGLLTGALGNSADEIGIAKAAAFELGEALVLVGQSFELVYKGAMVAYDGLKAAYEALHGNFKEAIDTASSGVDNFDVVMAQVNTTLEDIAHPVAALTVMEKEQATAFKATGDAASGAGDDVSDASAKSQASYVKLADKLKDLKDAYTGLTQSASTDLASLADDHVAAMKTIQESIAKTQQSITDLTASYSRQQTDDTASVADSIVASQGKVADLKKQMAAATTQDQYDQLQQQLSDEQKNLDSAAGFISTHQDAIATATARAGETDLQRTIDDYNVKQQLAQQAYQENLAQLNQELADEQAKSSAEVDLYTQRTAAINDILTKANADYKTLSQDRVAQTTDEVNTEIQLFQQLASAISGVKSASSSAISTIPVPTITSHKAGGGTVMSGNSYTVGENGPETFTPGSTGTITPSGGRGNGGGVTVIINGGYYLDDTVAQKLGDRIMDKLRLKARIGI